MGTFEFKYRNTHQKTTLTNIHRRVIDCLLDRKIPVDIEKDFPPYQADIYIPSKNWIVETDGAKWHGGKRGNDHDRTRDKILIEKYKVARVVRIIDADIKDNNKLKLIIDGIEQDNLLDSVKKGDSIILMLRNKNYRGTIAKINKFTTTAFIKSLKKVITIDKHGLTQIEGRWYRCVKMNKTTSLPIWIKSIGNRFEEAIKNRTLEEAQQLFKGIKDYIEAFDNGTLSYK